MEEVSDNLFPLKPGGPGVSDGVGFIIGLWCVGVRGNLSCLNTQEPQ